MTELLTLFACRDEAFCYAVCYAVVDTRWPTTSSCRQESWVGSKHDSDKELAA
jgi:hypothetical protein